MRTRADNSGSPSNAVLSILFALGEQKLHGYRIMKEVEEKTAGQVSLLPSSLYATIKRMVLAGWLQEAGDDSSETTPGRPRRLYQLTDEGRELAAREARRMSALLDMARANRLDGREAPAGGSGA